MGKHILLAFATSQYDETKYPKEFQRPVLSEVLTSVVNLFTTKLKRYQRELEEIGENPSKSDLENKLNDWSRSEQRDAGDWVVLYYTGHATVVGNDSLYLLTYDSVPGSIAITAFSLRGLADMLLEQSSPGRPRQMGRMLIILDTCYAGTGAIKLASEFRDMMFKYSRFEIYLLSATLPSEEAQAGELAKALIRSIEELSTRSATQEFFSVEEVMEQIRGRLTTQEAFCTPVMITGLPHFFPNPSWVDTGGRAVFANEAQRAIVDQEFRDHWGPRSRGVEFDTQAGDYFTGRTHVLKKIQDYLSRSGTTRPLVITGKAGAGKSAILSRTVSQSREPGSEIPALDIAVHAKGKTLADVVARFAAATGAPPQTKDILERLAQSEKAIRVLVDALDEAAEPEPIAEGLLRPMGATGAVNLLVGSRENCIPLLGDVDVIDIDLRQYAKDADIVEYATRRLLRKDEPDTPTPYARKEESATAAAAMIAKRADGNFLVARLLIEDLLLRPQAIDAAEAAEMALPATVAVAFDIYLSRFGAKETMVRDLLLPLAYTEGKGFPWANVWARVASDLSKRTYHDDDIRWLLSNAGAFILESVEDGQAVYRLYHLALQEAIRSRHDDRKIQWKLTDALVACVPRLPDGGKDWLQANRYIRRHLPAHAARPIPEGFAHGRRKYVHTDVSLLLLDPMFLVAAIPSGLLSVLRVADGYREVHRAKRIYKMAAHHWDANTSPGAWASYLEFTALKLRLHDRAKEFGALSISRPWRIPWVSLAPSPAHRILRGHQGPVRATAMIGDTVISAGDDGTICCWDTETGELKRDPFRGHEGAVYALAAGTLRNREVVVSGGEDSTVRIWSLQTGIEILPAMRAHEGPVYAILLAVLAGNSVIISGGNDGTIRFWNAATGKPMPTPIRAHGERIRALTFCPLEGTPAVISTGDNGSIRVWDAMNGKLLSEARSTNAVNALTCFELNGSVVLASANHSGRIEIWNPSTMAMVSPPLHAEYSAIFSLAASTLRDAALGDSDNDEGRRPIVIAGDVSGMIVIWDAETREIVGRPITEHDMGVFALARDDSRGLVTSGGLDGTVRLWDLEETQGSSDLPTPPFGPNSDVWSVAVCGSTVATRSYDRRIRVFDLATGEFVEEFSSGARSEKGVALGKVNDGSMLAFDMSGVIFVRELTAASLEVPLGYLGGKAHALLFHKSDEVDVLTAMSGSGEVKSWNVIERKEIRSLKIDLHDGNTSTLVTLADGRVTVLSGGSGSGFLRLWSATSGELMREIAVSRQEQAWTNALAIGEGGDPHWIAAGNSDGTVVLWDATSFEEIARLPGEASIYALTIASIGGRAAVVWGGKEHLLHAWWPVTNRRESIDLGFPVNAIAAAPDGMIVAGTTRGIVAIRFEL